MGYLYNYKIFENVQQAKSILTRLGRTEKDNLYIGLRELLKDHLGYLGWFTKMAFEKNVPFGDLAALFDRIKNNQVVIQNLPKNLIQYDDWEKMIDDYIRAEKVVNAKRIWNQFPSEQKELFQMNWDNIGWSNTRSETRRMVELFSQLYKLKDHNNFIRKVSRYKTKETFLEAIKSFVKGDRDTSYPRILQSVQRSDARIVHQDPDNDIIVCEVDYDQVRSLASNSSWCICQSKGTFNGYANGINLQYIIFLTDETGNKSKIGVTYGLKFITAHLLNDSFISESSLTTLLKERHFNLKKLTRDKEELLSSRGNRETSVAMLLEFGFTIEDIMKFKQTFTSTDLRSIPKNYIEEYKLLDKIAIDKTALSKVPDIDYLMKNLKRLSVDLDLKNLLRLSPAPRQLQELIKKDLLDRGAKDWFGQLEECRIDKSILERGWRFASYEGDEDYRGRSEKVEDFNGVIYALRYCGVTSHTHELKELLALRTTFDDFGRGEIKKFKAYLSGAGFDITKEDPNVCFQLFGYFLGSKFSSDSTTENWLDVLGELPMCKPMVKELVEKRMHERAFYDSALANIKKYYPDLYKEAKQSTKMINLHKEFINLLPSAQYQNGGLDRTPRVKRDEPNFQEIYTKYHELFKQWNWDKGWHNDEVKLYVVFILCKLGKIDEVKEMKLHFGYSFIGKVIRAAINMLWYNSRPQIFKAYQLTKPQAKKLFEWMLINIQPTKQYSNVEEDPEITRHHQFSLIYYMYNWGFDKYMEIVKRAKNNYHTSKQSGEGWKWITLRIKLLNHVLSYLALKGKWDEFKQIVNEVRSWKMGAIEEKETIWFLRHGMQLYGEDIATKKEEALASLDRPIMPEPKTRSRW